MARRADRGGSGGDNLSARTDVDKSGVQRPAGAAVTGPRGVEAPAVTGHDVPAREDEAVPPPEAGEDSAEQNLDRPATPQEGPVNGCEPELRPYKAGGTNQREPPVVPPCGDEEE